uniref:Uncharacterized protein n=1 Tax=Anguilla anguilla TaxID=7936 RepID=A0A0E9UNV0_ANGAN
MWLKSRSTVQYDNVAYFCSSGCFYRMCML